MIKHLAVGLLALSFSLAGCKGKEGDGGAGEAEAVAAADAWLALVDGERYGESWEQASSLFKRAVPSEAWTRQVGAVRQPLGKLVSRSVKNKQSATTLPGAPDGKYVVIQYDAVYESKAAAVETVTPMLDTDGKWRVSGYYIK